MKQLSYWVDVVATLCGFDGSAGFPVPGIMMIVVAGAVLIYAVYRTVTCTLWPGEMERDHIKYRILLEEDEDDAY